MLNSGDVVLITGSSGFIGTNLSEVLISRGIKCVLVDIKRPRITSHNQFYAAGDIRDFEFMSLIFSSHKPSYVINLAARTDLEGETLDDYDSNTVGVSVICDLCARYRTLIKRVVFISSMLVCKAGHIPLEVNEFSPPNIYGLSKSNGENLVRLRCDDLPDFRIARPTSIWGPWFSVPYRGFFEHVLRGTFFKIDGLSSQKTFGFVDNTVEQLLFLLEGGSSSSDILYCGDPEPISANSFADNIRDVAGLSVLPSIPKWVFIILAKLGDLLSRIGVKFPITSFRLKNMTTNNVIPIQYLIQPASEQVSLRDGIEHTLRWFELSRVQRKGR